MSSPEWKDLQISKLEAHGFFTQVRNRFVEEKKPAIEIWFETFVDLLAKKGYSIVRKDK